MVSPLYRILININNLLALLLGIGTVYQANAESIKLSKAPKSDDRDALDRMYFAVAIFAMATTAVNLLGSVIVNLNSEGLKLIYCVILGAFAAVFLVLTVLTVELIDEFEDRMIYLLYEAIVSYNHSSGSAFLDKIQRDLKCCGAVGVPQYRNCTSLFANCSLPDSCCPGPYANRTCTNSTAFKDTCEHKVTYSFESHSQWVVFSMLLMAGYFTVLIVLETVFRSREQQYNVEQSSNELRP